MDRERLARLLEEPGKVAREDIADLKALTEQFPWFSGAHLLRAIGERSSGDVMAEETLKVSAAHVPSRAVLYDLRDMSVEQAAAQLKQFSLNKSTKVGSARDEVVQEPAKIPIAKLQVEERSAIKETGAATDEAGDGSTSNPIGKLPVQEKISIEEEKEVIGSVDDLEITAPAIDHQAETEQETKAADLEQKAVPSEDPIKEELDRQIMEAAIASAYDLTWQEDVARRTALPKTDRSKKAPEPIIEPEAKRSGSDHNSKVERSENEPEITASSEDVDQQPQPTPIEKEHGAVVQPKLLPKLKFTDWLSLDQPGAPNSDQPEAEVAPASEFLDLGINEPADPIPSTPISGPALDPTALIDRFIEHENPAPVRKAEFFTPQQAAKKSLDDSAGIVSETLARIYEKQGNFAKALEAYRKLALKYPEKSSYFAGLSRILEEKLNA